MFLLCNKTYILCARLYIYILLRNKTLNETKLNEVILAYSI